MDMKKLFDDFVVHIESMNDEDIMKSIELAIEHSKNYDCIEE